jgi:hypothetical protein
VSFRSSATATETAEKLKKDAEELIRIAVEDRTSVVQIRNLHKRARTGGAVDFEIYLKYQMGRSDNRNQAIISKNFGNKLLSFLSKYKNQKKELVTLLKYSLMLYDYTNQTYSPNIHPENIRSLNDGVKERIKQVIKSKTLSFGFVGLNIEQEDRRVAGGKMMMMIHVKLNRFYGDPKELSSNLRDALKAEVNEIRNTSFNVWIDKERRY